MQFPKFPGKGIENVTRQKIREINGEKSWASVQSYEEVRMALIVTENSQAFDGQAVVAASALEKRANELVGAIRKEDEKEIYCKLKDKDGRQRVVVGHFLSNVNLINETSPQSSKEGAQRAYLHCHFNSCLRPEFPIEHARGRE